MESRIKIRFSFKPDNPLRPPSLNGPKGLMNMHWAQRKKFKENLYYYVKSKIGQLPRDKQVFITPVKVQIINYAVTLSDWDNLASRFKTFGDALVKAKMLKDDSPKFVHEFEMIQERVKHRHLEELIFIITSI